MQMAYGLLNAMRVLVGCITKGTHSMPSEDDVNRAAEAFNLTVAQGCDADQFKELLYLCNSGSAPPLTPGKSYAGVLHVSNATAMWDQFVTEFCRSQDEETSKALMIFAIVAASLLFLAILYCVGNRCTSDATKQPIKSDIWSPELQGSTATVETSKANDDSDDELRTVLLEG